MIIIRSIEEMLMFYTSLGGEQRESINGIHYIFPNQKSNIRFWGELHSFSAADVDFTFEQDTIVRTQFDERYIGIGFSEQGTVETYSQKKQKLNFGQGSNCFVFDSHGPFFMKICGGQRLKFRGLYFQESFFTKNNIPICDSFWRDAKNTINGADIHVPELESIYYRIEQCSLTRIAFDTWLKGVGLEAIGYIINIVQQLSLQQPVYLDDNEIRSVEMAKEMIQKNLKCTPTILDICKSVALNKNKLQAGFRFTEGKSIAEYTRTLRMELALKLLEDETLSMKEVAEKVGYHGISSFYSVFHRTFGETPAAIQKLLITK